jgi:putative toxin-antitoxin system antitoxin component (TIGR02293 family)
MAATKKPSAHFHVGGNIVKKSGARLATKSNRTSAIRVIYGNSSPEGNTLRMASQVSTSGHYLVENAIPGINNSIEIIEFIKRNTINFEYFDLLKNIVTFSDQTISDWLHISAKTFASYRTEGGTRPKENTQEQALMIIALYKHAEEVFDSNEDFNKWLNTPNFFFDNQKPLDDLGTISGIRFINDRLTAMAYGDNI